MLSTLVLMIYGSPPPLTGISNPPTSGNTPPPSSNHSVKIMRRAGPGGDSKASASNSAITSPDGPSKAGSEVGDDGSSSGSKSGAEPLTTKDRAALTREEREAKYKEARERNFKGFEETESGNASADDSKEMSQSSSTAANDKANNNKYKNCRLALLLGCGNANFAFFENLR